MTCILINSSDKILFYNIYFHSTDFNKNYYSSACDTLSQGSSINQTNTSAMTTVAMTTVGPNVTEPMTDVQSVGECLKENSILFLLLMLGTVWLGITLYNFTKT